MQPIKIQETKKNPYLHFDYQNAKLEIVGNRSMPDVSAKFYRPAIEWVKEYAKNPSSTNTLVVFKVEYFNTSSGKCFVEMFKYLDQLASKGHSVYLQWHYEDDDEDMQQCADDWEILLKNIKFDKISYSNN